MTNDTNFYVPDFEKLADPKFSQHNLLCDLAALAGNMISTKLNIDVSESYDYCANLTALYNLYDQTCEEIINQVCDDPGATEMHAKFAEELRAEFEKHVNRFINFGLPAIAEKLQSWHHYSTQLRIVNNC